MKVLTVFYIRHGFSCANATHFNISNIDFTKLNDSELTKTGIEYSRIAGKEFKGFCELNKIKINRVYSSAMMRAIETCYNMFPNRNIIISKYIKELVNEESDKLMSVKRKLNVLGRKYNISKLKCIERLYDKDVNEVNYVKFVRTMCKEYMNSRNPIIAVVSHSMFMKKFLNIEIPYNNGVYMVKYDMESCMPLYKPKLIIDGMIPNVHMDISNCELIRD